jgi:dihydrodipicolinate synthase/N-acetylneuraminate lyase
MEATTFAGKVALVTGAGSGATRESEDLSSTAAHLAVDGRPLA